MHRLMLIAVLGATACGPDRGFDGRQQRAEGGDAGNSAGEVDLTVPQAEDDQPLGGLDAETLLAMPLGTAPDRPCGLRRPVEKDLLNRFGWDEAGRLVIFDYVFLSSDEWELESRNVLFYDENGRLTDDVYVEGTQRAIHHHFWYQWEGDAPVSRSARPDQTIPGSGPVTIDGNTWRGPNHRFEYDPEALTLEVRVENMFPYTEYQLDASVEAADVIVAHGIFDSFRLMGPIVAAAEVREVTNDLTGTTTKERVPIPYERDEQGRITVVDGDELIYDCSMYD